MDTAGASYTPRGGYHYQRPRKLLGTSYVTRLSMGGASPNGTRIILRVDLKGALR